MRRALSDREVAEARELRKSDPETWTFRALAWKYGRSEGHMERIINRGKKHEPIQEHAG